MSWSGTGIICRNTKNWISYKKAKERFIGLKSPLSPKGAS